MPCGEIIHNLDGENSGWYGDRASSLETFNVWMVRGGHFGVAGRVQLPGGAWHHDDRYGGERDLQVGTNRRRPLTLIRFDLQ